MESKSRTHIEPHIKESSNIRDLVFGFGDGINTSLGIVSGVGGVAVAADIVILPHYRNVYRCQSNGSSELPSSKVSKGDIRIRNKTRRIRDRECSRIRKDRK